MLAMEQIVGVLVTAGLGTAGSSLFAYDLPPTTNQALVALTQMADTMLDSQLAGFWIGSFQLIGRDPALQGLRTRLVAATTALTWQKPRQLPASGDMPAVTLSHCRPRHHPIFFPRSPGGYLEASITFDFAGHPD